MKGPIVVLALFIAAQVVAGATMVGLGKTLQAVNPDAGWVAWAVVGLIAVAASVAFLCFAFNLKRWSQWPAR